MKSVLAVAAVFPSRLLWPDAQRIHIAASIVGLAVMAAMLISQIRRRRQLGRGGPP